MAELAVILLLAVVGSLVVWWMSSLETDDTQIMDRQSAEQAARADTSGKRDAQRETQAERTTDETRL